MLPQDSGIGEDMVEGVAQALKRRPEDPVRPNKRRSHVKEEMKVLKRKVGTVCRNCHPRYTSSDAIPSSEQPCDSPPVHPRIPLLTVACDKSPDMSDMLVRSRDLKSACGGMAAYAVIFAAETSSHGRDSVGRVVFASDNCLLTSVGFDLRETGPEPGYQIAARIYQALAKEKDMQRCAYFSLPLCNLILLTTLAR